MINGCRAFGVESGGWAESTCLAKPRHREGGVAAHLPIGPDNYAHVETPAIGASALVSLVAVSLDQEHPKLSQALVGYIDDLGYSALKGNTFYWGAK